MRQPSNPAQIGDRGIAIAGNPNAVRPRIASMDIQHQQDYDRTGTIMNLPVGGVSYRERIFAASDSECESETFAAKVDPTPVKTVILHP